MMMRGWLMSVGGWWVAAAAPQTAETLAVVAREEALEVNRRMVTQLIVPPRRHQYAERNAELAEIYLRF
jgi:hypothetical protein